MGDGLKRARAAARATRKTPEAGKAAAYAAAVVRVLRDHFPSTIDQATADAVTEWVYHQARNPVDSFEVIIDDPGSARWRLKAAIRDHGRVRLAYCPVSPPGSESQRELERTINDALRALED